MEKNEEKVNKTQKGRRTYELRQKKNKTKKKTRLSTFFLSKVIIDFLFLFFFFFFFNDRILKNFFSRFELPNQVTFNR